MSLVALLAAPTMAAPPAELRDPEVSPRAGGHTRTIFHIEVTFEDDADKRPDFVRFVVDGDNHWMFRGGGHDWDRGVGYDWFGRLPAGSHSLTFFARTDGGQDLSLDGGTLMVDGATPEPTPTPTPEPTPEPTPTATPEPTPAPTAKPAPKPTPKPTPRPTAEPPDPTAHPTPRDTEPPAAVPTAEPGTGAPPTAGPTLEPPTAGPTLEPSFVAVASDDPSIQPSVPSPSIPPTASPSTSPSPAIIAALPPGTVATDPNDPSGDGSAPAGAGAAAGDAPSWGPLSGVIVALGLGDGSLPVLPLLPTVVGTSGAAVASMALGLFGRRRREDDQPEPEAVLAVHAAEGIGVGGGAAHGLAAIVVANDPDAYDEDAEALLPRWRRPSLLQARRADPLRTNAQAPRLTFDEGFSGALAGRERRQIRYTVVRLLDSPDELRGNEIGALGEGDEVELLERQGSYWLVACPDGGRGWVHKMTLGSEVGGRRPVSTDAPSASLPLAAETWTMGESDIDDDVLAAYLASRQRRD